MKAKIEVKASKAQLCINGVSYPCALGKHGWVEGAMGREGDGKTPLGRYGFRYVLYRADRVSLPVCNLPAHPLRPDDGWCDAPDDPAYNRPVRLPYPARAESLWRDSPVYDVIVVLGHNDNPPKPGLGSAVFFHVAREVYGPTQGCVAVSKEHMLEILPLLTPKDVIEIGE